MTRLSKTTYALRKGKTCLASVAIATSLLLIGAGQGVQASDHEATTIDTELVNDSGVNTDVEVGTVSFGDTARYDITKTTTISSYHYGKLQEDGEFQTDADGHLTFKVRYAFSESAGSAYDEEITHKFDGLSFKSIYDAPFAEFSDNYLVDQEKPIAYVNFHNGEGKSYTEQVVYYDRRITGSREKADYEISETRFYDLSQTVAGYFPNGKYEGYKGGGGEPGTLLAKKAGDYVADSPAGFETRFKGVEYSNDHLTKTSVATVLYFQENPNAPKPVPQRTVGTLENPYSLAVTTMPEGNPEWASISLAFTGDGGRLFEEQQGSRDHVLVNLEYVHTTTGQVVSTANAMLYHDRLSVTDRQLAAGLTKWPDGEYEVRAVSNEPYVDKDGGEHYYSGKGQLIVKDGQFVTGVVPTGEETRSPQVDSTVTLGNLTNSYVLDVTAMPEDNTEWIGVTLAFTADGGRLPEEQQGSIPYVRVDLEYVNTTTGQIVSTAFALLYHDRLFVTDRQLVAGFSRWPDGEYEVRAVSNEPYIDKEGGKHYYSGKGKFTLTGGKAILPDSSVIGTLVSPTTPPSESSSDTPVSPTTPPSEPLSDTPVSPTVQMESTEKLDTVIFTKSDQGGTQSEGKVASQSSVATASKPDNQTSTTTILPKTGDAVSLVSLTGLAFLVLAGDLNRRRK